MNEDLPFVIEQAKEMLELCRKPHGKFPSAFAIAHAQVSEEPLRFFVMADGLIVINPEITDHTKTFVERREGCYSYPMEEFVLVKRWNKCAVRYFREDFSVTDEKLQGKESQIFQHEIDHMNAKYIHDDVDKAS